MGASRQYWRDIILGVNDGLVSMFLLVAGVVGGGLDRRQVLLTAVAGAIAGAVSMAAGEYLATKSQSEVLESEIDLEKTHIEHFRNRELAQLYQLFRDIGIAEEDLPDVVRAFSRDDQTLLNAMKVMEFGMVDSEERSPITAMLMSGGLFLGGLGPVSGPVLVRSQTSRGSRHRRRAWQPSPFSRSAWSRPSSPEPIPSSPASRTWRSPPSAVRSPTE